MSQSVRKRELLKPPEPKPTLTLLLIFVCVLMVGDPTKGWGYNQWCADHSVTAQKFFSALEKNDFMNILNMTFQATFAQLGPLAFVFNTGFWWIFSSVVEIRLLSWRYPVFLFIGMLGCWAILVYGVGYTEPSQRFIGPYLFIFYLLGAYLIYKPKKPFKPQDWKPVPWKIFKGDAEHGIKKSLKMPFVSPWIYISLFLAYVGALHAFTSIGGRELVNLTHFGFISTLQKQFVGSITARTIQVMSPLPAVESCLLGIFTAYVLSSIVIKPKLRRDAGELQVQAILQYKELRALDMNHKQAVEGTAKLIGVPLDIAKDWIAKGLQTPPSNDNQ